MPKTQIVQCPHCGNKTGQSILFSHTTEEDFYDSNGKSIDCFEVYYYLTECATCSKVSLFSNWELSDSPGSLSDCRVFYPITKMFSTEVPEEIRKTYNESLKVKNISPDAFSVLIRKALEYLCHDQGVRGYNLKKMVDKLTRQGLIPGNLSKMTDAIRIVGNLGAHAAKVRIGKKEAEIIHDFFIALVEYIYIAPKKISDLRNKLGNTGDSNTTT